MKIYVAGHRGLVGSAIVRNINAGGNHSWVGATRQELDLFDRKKVFEFVKKQQPDAVVIAAARVGGINANNTFPVEFLTENLQIEMSLLDACHAANVPKVLFLGSSCIYPRMAPQPIKEEYLLTGELEPTNEAYALSKIAGIKLVQGYRREYGRKWISAMPTNLYGIGDNFHPENSHVLPAMLRRLHEAKTSGAKTVTMWGSGTPRREFLHVDDLAEACVFLLETYDGDIPLNVGCGTDVTIKELAETVARVTEFQGTIEWDSSKPDGTPQKLLDTSRINQLGWLPSISLEDGILNTYKWFLEKIETKEFRS
ncbi:MAG: GDP-L-fucose synthase [Actinobacteria bacterium]|nr:GDP-L-fucose synthase [Actinomycetota bacterium]